MHPFPVLNFPNFLTDQDTLKSQTLYKELGFAYVVKILFGTNLLLSRLRT